MTFISWKVRVW